ncbi:DUF3592 domain-containing protein [Turneriella parva]|nr:DUF3592 domain-containing protein [Turneriella parva]
MLARLKIGKKTAIAIILLSGSTALWFGGHFIRDSYQLYRAQNWSEASGVVTHALFDTLPDDDSDGFGPANLRELLQYSYEFDGKTYSSRRYGPFARWNIGSNVAKYEEGQHLNVFVNDHNPSESVVDRRVRSGFWLYLVISTMAIVWFVWGVLAMFRHERFFQAFLGQALMLVSFLAFNFALLASGGARDANWWLVAAGFFGGLILSGLSMIVSLWSATGHAVLFLMAVVGGLVSVIIGVVRGGTA